MGQGKIYKCHYNYDNDPLELPSKMNAIENLVDYLYARCCSLYNFFAEYKSIRSNN